RDATLLLQRGAGLRVDLGDLHALRADLRADAAAGAVVDGGVGRAPAAAESLALRTGVLRAREEGRGRREGAVRLADRALDAVVDVFAHPGPDSRPWIASAARIPLARLIPSPDFPRHGSAPASMAPTAWTFS